MRQSSADQYSLHSEGLRAVLVRSTTTAIKMKYAVFFLLCCLALAAAAPQLITTFPGLVAPGIAPFVPRTVVAGPTVVNGFGWGGPIVAPGVVTSVV